MIDLHWADDTTRKSFNCKTCKQADRRGCKQPGYDHLKKPMMVSQEFQRSYKFCPGKATWSRRMAVVYEQCLMAYRTGILPGPGHFEDQDALFYRCYPIFVAAWKEQEYQRQMKDLASLLNSHAEAVLAPWKSKRQGGR